MASRENLVAVLEVSAVTRFARRGRPGCARRCGRDGRNEIGEDQHAGHDQYQ